MKLIQTIALSITLIMSSIACGIHHDRNSSESTYKAWDDPNDEIYYEGNIVVQTFNSGGEPLPGTKIEIFYDKKLLSQIELRSTYTGVFNEDVETIIVRASKEGYQTSTTQKIKLDDELACFISFNLATE